MRVVITGGSGLIGRACAAALAAGGDEVVLLSRTPGRVQDLPAGVRAVGWDGRSGQDWQELLGREVGILHLAGENIGSGLWTAGKKKQLRESRLRSGAAVVAAINAAAGVGSPPAVLLQASGVSIYGNTTAEVDETAPLGRGFLADLAGDWEASTAAVEALGVRRVVARLGVVLAREGGALPKLLLPFRFGVGGRMGSGQQWVSWIHRDDLVAGLSRLLHDAALAGVFNLCAPEPVTNRHFASAAGAALHRPSLLPTPALALRLLGEMSDVLLGGQRVVPGRLAGLGFGFRYPTIEAALHDLVGSRVARAR